MAVDTMAGSVGAVAEYKTMYDTLRRAERELLDMQSEAELLRRDEEWLRFQVEEFEAAALHDGATSIHSIINRFSNPAV